MAKNKKFDRRKNAFFSKNKINSNCSLKITNVTIITLHKWKRVVNTIRLQSKIERKAHLLYRCGELLFCCKFMSVHSLCFWCDAGPQDGHREGRKGEEEEERKILEQVRIQIPKQIPYSRDYTGCRILGFHWIVTKYLQESYDCPFDTRSSERWCPACTVVEVPEDGALT